MLEAGGAGGAPVLTDLHVPLTKPEEELLEDEGEDEKNKESEGEDDEDEEGGERKTI